MTTLAQARERIYQAFVDAAVIASSRLTFDNEAFQPTAGETWIRLSVRHRVREQETLGKIGTRKYESIGSVFVQCFGPLDKGMAAVDNLATLSRAAFEGKVLLPEHIRCYSATVRELGVDDAWVQTNVEVLFTYDETK